MDPEHQKRIINYCRINQLLTLGLNHLRKIFHDRWETYHKLNIGINSWNNDNASGNELLKLISASTAAELKTVLQSGKTDLWDISLTNKAIQVVSKKLRNRGKKTCKKEDKLINNLRKIRDKMAHSPTSELPDDEFENLWKKIENILIKFGEDVAIIDKVKENMIEFSPLKVECDPESDFVKLKDSANKLFKEQAYKEAIQIYDKILQLPNLLPEKQAIIFSDRSAAYLKLADEISLQMAKRDAEWAIQSWPCWWNGYFQLGCVQFKLKEFMIASINFDTALALNPESKEVMNEISDIRKEYGIISREEHYRPAQQPISYNSATEKICNRMSISKEEFDLNLNLLKATPYGDIIKGHYFRDGEGVKQDYLQAAACYAKAAKTGIPEGMYNLALLYEHGKGVKKDYDESLRWLEKAANYDGMPTIGSGIPEAQHLLGLKYFEGVGVDQSYKTAAEWYQKAVNNAFPPSANNLGLLYKHGYGVERSLTKAFEYFKIAAQGGDTPSMINLAQCYFAAEGTESTIPSKADIIEGMKWLKVAADNGDMVAERELERRQKLSPEETRIELVKEFLMSASGLGPEANPLDEKQFRKEVEKAAKNGSIIAQRQLNIWDNINHAFESFKKKDSTKLCTALAKAIRLHPQLVDVPKIFHQTIRESINTDPDNMDVIICFVRMNANQPLIVNYVQKIMESIGIDGCLFDIIFSHLIATKESENAVYLIEPFLTVTPNHLPFLYLRAIALCMQKSPTDECIKALDYFLAVAPKDHDKVPACHYRKASYFAGKNKDTEFKTSIEAGIAAEKHQLPCFLPYQFPMKDLLMKTYKFGGMQQMKNALKNSYLSKNNN